MLFLQLIVYLVQSGNHDRGPLACGEMKIGWIHDLHHATVGHSVRSIQDPVDFDQIPCQDMSSNLSVLLDTNEHGNGTGDNDPIYPQQMQSATPIDCLSYTDEYGCMADPSDEYGSMLDPFYADWPYWRPDDAPPLMAEQ